jgi:small subunit ribosomal protein S3
MAVGETSGEARPRRVISAGGGRRRPDQGAPGEPVPEGTVADDAAPTDEAVPAEAETEAKELIQEVDPDLERLLAEEEEIERRTREHHETPHFHKDVE